MIGFVDKIGICPPEYKTVVLTTALFFFLIDPSNYRRYQHEVCYSIYREVYSILVVVVFKKKLQQENQCFMRQEHWWWWWWFVWLLLFFITNFQFLNSSDPHHAPILNGYDNKSISCYKLWNGLVSSTCKQYLSYWYIYVH